MLRFLMLTLGLWAAAGSLTLSARPVLAQDVASQAEMNDAEMRLWQAMRMDDLMPIMRDEAVESADELAASLFDSGPSLAWRDQIASIHDPARLTELLQAGLAEALAGQPPEHIDAVIAFYESDLGTRLLQMETSARAAMIDAEDSARASYSMAAANGAPRVEQITRLIEAADLIEPNIASAMNAVYAFTKAMTQTGATTVPMTDREILAVVWSQEPDIRVDTRDWVRAFLLLAYSPLSDEELEEYIAFAGSPAGQTVMTALTSAFDSAFTQLSQDTGQAAGIYLMGQQL